MKEDHEKMRKKLFTAFLLGLVLSLCGVAGAFASYLSLIHI